MHKDPTAFRERFKRWKETGEYLLPKFEDGYESFRQTLPENQKKGYYPTRRYWELNDKPKDFAEAIGRGMYTILPDGWHAGSIAYNKDRDVYEFMKANYHPTRWMEQVYGYDQSPLFLKDWKVQYNGPMLSDRYVRREKPGLKVKGGLLPRFALGEENIKRVYAPYYDADGTLVRNVDAELPELVVTGTRKTTAKPNYNELANQERARQRLIAKEYITSTPSIGNLYNAADAFVKSLPVVGISSEEVNPYVNKGDAPSPGMRSPKEIIKATKNIGLLVRTDARILNDADLDFAAQYNRIKSFLTSDVYKNRLLRYYRDKGSSIVTQNHAPEQRIGELLYNIETTHPTVKPRGKLVDRDGSFLSKEINGIYHPEEHTILVVDELMGSAVPRHEMFHARNRGNAYMDNEKYRMRTKHDFVNDIAKNPYTESIEDARKWLRYYGDVVEQEPRVLNTLEAMQKEGYDINNLSDKLIYDFLYDRPIEMHNSDTRSLIDNYVPEDIPAALRNFKNIIVPLGFGGIGYGAYNKYAE